MKEKAPYNAVNNEISEINLRINALKAELIGLTQVKDRLQGNPVSKNLTVTVDVLPSTFSSAPEEQKPQPRIRVMGMQQQSGTKLEEDYTYDPRTIRLARRAHKLSEDIRSCKGCDYCLNGR